MCCQLLGPSASMPSALHVPSVPQCHRSGYSYYRQPWWTYVWRPLSFRLFILLSIVLIIFNLEKLQIWYLRWICCNTFLNLFYCQVYISDVIPQFDWLCDVCGCVMSPTSDIYWVDLGFINNYKEPQWWLILLRYSADVASAFPWVVTYGIRAIPVIPCGLRDTTAQSALTRTFWI